MTGQSTLVMFGATLAAVFSCSSAFRVSRQSQKGSTTSSLLEPISTAKPDAFLHPSQNRQTLGPAFHAIEGPKHTNKFWGNWAVAGSGLIGDEVDRQMTIYATPWGLRFNPVGNCSAGELIVSNPLTPDFIGDPVELIISHFFPEFKIGALEALQGDHAIVKEGHLGIHAQVRSASGGKITYPVYNGMAYVTARFEGGLTPRVSADALLQVVKVQDGIWRFFNNRGSWYRVYVFTSEGKYVDGSYSFDGQGLLNQQLDGWVRLAHEIEPSDAARLDQHAPAILTGMEFDVSLGSVEYNFETANPTNAEVLHFGYANHMEFLSGGAVVATDVAKSMSSVKGLMTPLVGNVWKMQIPTSEVLELDFLPAKSPSSSYFPSIQSELDESLEFYSQEANWKTEIFRKDHYFSGKAYQKLSMICLMSAKVYGKSDARTQTCASALAEGFKCMYQREAGDADRATNTSKCWWAPPGTYYDEDWKGIPSRWADDPVCGLDFGNSCYNDHHYHFGYYVVAGAVLLDLIPSYKNDKAFVDFINTFIRDTSNPSKDDPYFPHFRTFDWFDMHSWSRGLRRNPDGKDQESTSEEVNLHYGVMLWGRMLGNSQMEQLGATMLAAASAGIRQYFLMMRNNPNYPAAFSKTHVTGIFFQGKVHRITWFGGDTKFIHGIQMLPMTPSVPLSRSAAFAQEEWEDELAVLPNSATDRWTSILLTGGLAMFNPQEAFNRLSQQKSTDYDDGLTKAWALWWTATRDGI